MPSSHVSDWRSRGACASADPDLFFPISSTGSSVSQLRQAKAICGGCAVQPQCLSFAMATQQAHGVWGGTSEDERKLLRRDGARRAAAGAQDQAGRPLRETSRTPAGSRAG